MPRKNCFTALVLVLVLALTACLAGQAAAWPLMGGARAAVNDSTAGDLLGTVWGWLADKWATIGHVIAGPAGHAPGALEKNCPGIDPNGACK
jgi:hypothetical protein